MQHHEECWAMYLNGRQRRTLGVSCISRSGIDCTVVDIRIVLQTALVSMLRESSSLTTTLPARPWRHTDNNLTSQLKKGCEAIGIRLLDHIILTEDSLSYMDEGML